MAESTKLKRHNVGKRTVAVDRKTKAKLDGEPLEKRVINEADMPIPDDGIDHSRWSPEARRLAELLTTGEGLGKTAAELGVMCGYSERSVKRYRNEPEFKAYLNALVEKRQDDLFRKATLALEKALDSVNPNVKAIELALRVVGKLGKDGVTVNVNNGKTSDDDDLDGELESLRRDAGVEKSVN